VAVCSLIYSVQGFGQEKLKNFRGTSQKLALIAFHNEYVELSVADNLLQRTRSTLSKYSRTFDSSSIDDFKLVSNPDNKYFKPAEPNMGDAQKAYLEKTEKDNKIDIIVLAAVRRAEDGLEMALQLFDGRIHTLSAVERSDFTLKDRRAAIEDLVYRTMNYLDRDGYVHPEPQDFLEKPVSLSNREHLQAGSNISDKDFFITPDDLGGAPLAGQASIGGEKTPFWEKWWFWTLVFGPMVAAGGLSYYFLVVDQPPSRANVHVSLPSP